MSPREQYAELCLWLALHAKPHKQTLHKGSNVIRNSMEDAKAILRDCARIQKRCEEMCNGIERYDPKLGRCIASWTEKDQQRADASIDASKARIEEIIRDYKTTALNLRHSVEVQRDPRGSVVRIFFKDGMWAF